MRKLGYYSKLAVSNLVRNRTTYLPYLLACVVSVFTFYALLAINFNDGVMQMRGEVYIRSFTAVGTVLLGIFCIILLFYTNSFLIKRRKKELGLYSILGMEKANIAIVLSLETLFTGVAALVLGLAAGMLLTRLLYLLLLRLVRFPVMINLPVSLPALAITTGFFAFVFLLTLLFNLRQVRLANPVQLLSGAKEGEKEPRSSWILTLLGLASLAAGYIMALRVSSSVEAILLFLVAAFLVIIGTYCLFISGSIAFLKLLRRKKDLYYTPRHFISISGMLYRMKQNAAGLASICILSCMVLVTVSSTAALYAGAEDALLKQFPFEYMMTCYDVQSADAVQQEIERLTEENKVTPVSPRRYRNLSVTTVRIQDAAFSSDTAWEQENLMTDVTMLKFMPLEDYNALEGTQESLAPGEALVFPMDTQYTADTLTLDGSTYRVRLLESYSRDRSGLGMGPTLRVVLPDMAALQAVIDAADPGAMLARTENGPLQAIFEFDLEGGEEDKEAFLQGFREYVAATPTERLLVLQARSDAKEGWYMMHGGFMFLGLFFGLLFLLAAAMIIYYKQISEGYDDRERYVILQKVGMSSDEVRRTIGSQIRSVFFLPLGVAVVHTLVATTIVGKGLQLFGITSYWALLLATLFTVLMYTLIYTLVYRRTAKSYFRIVRFA